MEARDVLANHVQIGRPPALERRLVGSVANAGDVVGQRIAPDVDDVLGIPGERNSPLDRRARDAEILEPGLQPYENFVAPALRLDEIRMLIDVILKAILVFREREEV